MKKTVLNTILFIIASLSLAYSQSRGYLSGKITGAEGQGVAGVTIIARNLDVRAEESTVTDAKGAYRFALDFPGNLELIARRIGFTEAKKQIRLSSGQKMEVDLVLAVEKNPLRQLPYSSFISLLPDGWAKREYILLDWAPRFPAAVLEQKSEEQLARELKQALDGRRRGGLTQESYIRPEAAARWAARYVSLGEHNDLKMPAAPTPDAAAVKITEFFLPETGATHDLYVDKDDIAWSTEKTGALYKLNTRTGELRLIPVPFEPKSPQLGVRNIVPAKDGVNFWIVMFIGKIAAFNPKTEKFGQVFDLAKEFGQFSPHTVKVDNEGNLWAADYHSAYPGRGVKVDVHSGKMTLIDFPALPLPFERKSTEAYGLSIGSDGHVWVCLLNANTFVEIDPRTLRARARELPYINCGPRRLDVSPDGIVWIPGYSCGTLIRFDPRTEEFKEFRLPTSDSGPYTVKVHPRTGEVWIVTSFSDQVYRYYPKTSQFSVYQAPNRLTWPRDIVFHPTRDNEVWLVQHGRRGPSIARIEF